MDSKEMLVRKAQYPRDFFCILLLVLLLVFHCCSVSAASQTLLSAL